MKLNLTLIVILAVLTACTVTPQQTLQEKLESKTAQERRDFLYSECRKEATYRTNIRHTVPEDHFQGEPEKENPQYRLKRLCKEMKKQMTGEE